ncbi:hypothetical protein BVRB_013720, partial [Beta vulgaris subsp. vulgaris]
MSDQSDSQNAPSEVFMTESDPSSPLADNDYASDSSPVGRTRHPPVDVVPGLDVAPLREHAWLDSLADAGVRVSSDFYDRLQEFATPNHPVVNLGDKSDSIATIMARDDISEAIYQHRTGVNASVSTPLAAAANVASSSRLAEVVADQGLNAPWLPEDASAGPLTVEIDGLWRFANLNLDVLGVDKDYRPLTNLPRAPANDYETMHGITNGRRGGNRHGPHNLRRGRGGVVTPRVPTIGAAATASTSVPLSPAIPLRSTASRTVTRGGPTRRRPREQVATDTTANKRLDVEDPGTSTANEVHVEDLDLDAPEETQERAAVASGSKPPSGTSCLEWIEKKEVPLSDSVGAAFAAQPITPGKIYQPNWNVREDESLYSDIPENGGILAYRILKGMQLPLDRPSGSLVMLAVRLTHDQLVGLLKDAEGELAPLKDEVETLRERAALLEETGENINALTKDVETANTEKEVAVLDASAEAEVRGVAKAVAEFKASDEYEWIEKKEVPLSDSVGAAFAAQPITPGKIYQPDWNVREDESLYSDIPENGGILAYRILKGMQLPLDRLLGSLVMLAARLTHDQLVGLLKDAEGELAPLKDEVETLRERAALLEETGENIKALTKDVETANTEKEVAVLDASAEAEVRGVAKAVAEFKASDEYEWIEKKEVPLSDSVGVAFAAQPITPGKIYQHDWNVREDESLYSDIPENGGILAYRILKGMQLPLDRLLGSLVMLAARLTHDQLVGLLKDAEGELAPLKDEVETLRERAALLEETGENIKALTKDMETANTEKEVAVLDASAEAEVRGVAKAVAEFKASDEYGLLKDAEGELAPLKDEVETLRERAALLEETGENIKALTKDVETANTEKEVAVLDASAEAEVRGVAKAVAEFKASDEY